MLLAFLWIGAVVGWSSGCSESPAGVGIVEPIDALPRALAAQEVQVVEGSNTFAWRLLAASTRGAPDESNVLLSPFSASMALGMTLNGARGSTREQMELALGLSPLSADEINAGFTGLAELLVGLDRSVRLRSANSVWHDEGFPVEASFLDVVRDVFHAEIGALDFTSPAAPETIDAWVERATAGRIPDIVDPPIDAATVMFLINAVHFKAPWTYAFDPAETQDAPFYTAAGDTLSIPTMRVRSALPYARVGGLEVVELPYGGGAFAMTIVLPPAGSLDAEVERLDADRWSLLLDALREPEVTVFLPRFSLSYEEILNDALRVLGMEDAFARGLADFTPMNRDARARGLYVSEAKQKTFVEVSEEGTEAAAATSVEVRELSLTDRTITVRVDRPFLYVIRERLTGTVLFTGLFRTADG